MPATTLSNTLRDRPAEMLAVLGLVSGALSAAWGQAFDLEPLQPVAQVFFLDPGAMPIGFFYGVAMGLGVAAWARQPWAAIVLIITTMYAWSAAVHTAIRLQSNTGDDAHLVAASLCAGAVGAGLTQLGCSLFSAELRRLWRIRGLVTLTLAVWELVVRERRWQIVLPTTVGAVAGMLFYMGERKMIDERLLYLVWQPAVAFCIGLGLRRQAENAQPRARRTPPPR